ncbi:tetratricopeptide repeat protein [Flavobacterium psychrotolerans]|uniref:BatC protein n=1 Tax=Flavobacterium psychrotolerans TaxID=2169410 RepID=A0A2U1JPI2_9FLAO|nr:tetratricopeptide repeat protein [Flavobacterium psychrotolerans]PWA06884.1 BatC protein [Flavobacterium psychrotolerans]
MKNSIIYGVLLLSLASFAQEKDKNLPKGNEEFVAKKYTDAEADYRISQSKSPKNAIASYNLGNAIYMQNQVGEAKYSYLKAIENTNERSEKHQAFHNLGNVLMKEKNYTQAVEAYKNALRNNPGDEETRYNYALAKKMLKENPPKKDDKKDNKNDKKDDKKDKKDKDKKDDKKDGDKDKKDDKKEGDKNPKNDKGNDKQQGQPQPKPGGISKERLQSLMDAVNNEEKKVQDKVNAQKVKGKPVQTEKDW